MTSQVQDSTSKQGMSHGKNILISDTDKQVVSKAPLILAALGGVLALGGLFTLLAASQVLPVGATLISGLGLPMKVVSVAAIAGGSISVVGLPFYDVRQGVNIENFCFASSEKVESRDWVADRLQLNEIFIVEDKKGSALTVYSYVLDDMDIEDKGILTWWITYNSSDSREEIKVFLEKETQKGKVVTTLEQLQQRLPITTS